jgi:pimeloyl-ACP methyl ester carboxylesterase
MPPVSQRKRPQGVLAMGLSSISCALTGRVEHLPPDLEYPESVVRRISFEAGGGHGWKLSALWTPREQPAPWKIVVVTGAPSWAEYWTSVMATLPADREMLVVDRPGFAHSEPHHCVPEIDVQAEALLPALEAAPGQKVLLVGQSYGAAIATLMAAKRPDLVHALALVSGFFGHAGPTAKFWVDVGSKILSFIPRDLKHAVMEVTGQPGQLNPVFKLLARRPFLITFIHGSKDDFAPIEVARRAAQMTLAPSRFIELTGADHFLNDGPPERLIYCLETAIRGSGALYEVIGDKPAPAEDMALAS